MSYIKDYPCPCCGANLYKTGFNEVYSGGFTRTNHYFIRGFHKIEDNTEFNESYIECPNCLTEIDEDLAIFLLRVELEWDVSQ